MSACKHDEWLPGCMGEACCGQRPANIQSFGDAQAHHVDNSLLTSTPIHL